MYSKKISIISQLLVLYAFIIGCKPDAGQTLYPPTSTQNLTTMEVVITFTPPNDMTATHKVEIHSTLAPEGATKMIAEMIKTNGNCKLPCWWGILPGQTTVGDVKDTLGTFIPNITPYPSQADQEGLSFYFNDPFNSNFEYGVVLYSKNGIIERINALSFRSLSDLFEEIGIPKEIWIHSSGVSMGSYPPSFSFALVYPDQGIAVYLLQIFGDYVKHNGAEYAQFCPSNIAERKNLNLYLWSPKNELALDEIFESIYRSTDFPKYKRLQEVSDMNEQTFSEVVTTQNVDQCLKTPLNIWP
ncbi:MAG: hypothetical protein HND47_20055 [Chloroflexi bacterium]|nr:hypothetical protein [Chloroflexota bacterium]